MNFTHRMVPAFDWSPADAIVAITQNIDSQLLVFLCWFNKNKILIKQNINQKNNMLCLQLSRSTRLDFVTNFFSPFLFILLSNRTANSFPRTPFQSHDKHSI